MGDPVSIGPLLADLRHRSGRSQAQQASVLSELSGRPVTRNEVSRWENEARLLTPYWQKFVAQSYGVDEAGLCEAVADTKVRRRRDTVAVTSAVDEMGDMRRRQMLGLAAGTVGAGLLSALEPARRMLDSALVLPSTECDADEWERVADDYSRLVGFRSILVADLLPQLLLDFDEARTRLETSSDVTRRRMARVCGLLSALVAISLVSAECWLEANRYWRTAQRAAELSGDRDLMSLIPGRRAVFALYSEMSDRSILDMATQALSVAASPSTGVVSALAARAQLTARQGNTVAARSALSDLEEMLPQLPEAVVTDLNSQWGWSEQRLRHVQSYVYSVAGDENEAIEAQNAALALYPSTSFQGPTQIHLHRAMCMVAAGDPTEGLRHIVGTMEALPPRLRGDGIIRRSAFQALEALPSRVAQLPDARQVRELLAPKAQS